MNTKLKLVLGFVVISIAIIFWGVFVVADLENIPNDYKLTAQLEGNTRILPSIGEELGDPIRTNDILRNELIKKEGNILEISSTWEDYDILTGDKVWEYSNTYFVDVTTHKHVGIEDRYYSFPPNVKKQNYDFFDPWTIIPSTFVFEKTIFVDDLEVYVFSCESLGNDLSFGYPQFSPRIVWNDTICEIWVEPISGQEIFIEFSFDNNFFEDGSKIPVHIGSIHTTEFTTSILIDSAKQQKELHFFYETILPILMFVSFSGILFSIIFLQDTLQKRKREFEILKQTNKQKEEFLSTLSHELRTPLVPIKGTCDILLDKDFADKLSDEQRKHIQSILSNSKRLDFMIDRLLLAQRLDLGKYQYKMENILVKEYTNQIYSSYSSAMSKAKTEFVNSIKNDLVVWGDKNALHEVFSNLLNNAISFVPKENARIEIGADKKDGKVEFFIKNNGKSIPADKQVIIFDSFYQLDSSLLREHGGLGLGLTICKKLVKGMNGKIWVESKKGMGSTFYFTLKTGEKK